MFVAVPSHGFDYIVAAALALLVREQRAQGWFAG